MTKLRNRPGPSLFIAAIRGDRTDEETGEVISKFTIRHLVGTPVTILRRGVRCDWEIEELPVVFWDGKNLIKAYLTEASDWQLIPLDDPDAPEARERETSEIDRTICALT